MDSIKDLLKKKANEFDDSSLKTAIKLAQTELERFVPEKAVITGFKNDNLVFVVTPEATIASDLRLQQIPILEAIEKSLNKKFERLIIKIQQD